MTRYRPRPTRRQVEQALNLIAPREETTVTEQEPAQLPPRERLAGALKLMEDIADLMQTGPDELWVRPLWRATRSRDLLRARYVAEVAMADLLTELAAPQPPEASN